MPRYWVNGSRNDHWSCEETAADVYVDARDRDDACRKARGAVWWVKEVREVRHDAGRGLLWRLWRWLRGG